MSDHPIHDQHHHQHGTRCGHQAIVHNDHTDYLHDGHLHHLHDNHVDEHRLDVTGQNPATCTPSHHCDGHDTNHRHGATCGHQAIPHGDHVDYLVAGHLHFAHDTHCDDHGVVQFA